MDYSKLKALAEKATPGPWVYDDLGQFVYNGTTKDMQGNICDLRGFGAGYDLDTNGQFIAAANPVTIKYETEE